MTESSRFAPTLRKNLGGSGGTVLTTKRFDYNVVMAYPVSVRFRDPRVLQQLKAEATARGCSSSALAEQLIAEGLRSRRHPLVGFRDGATGRRAILIGGPDVWEVVSGVIGGDVRSEERVDRAVQLFGLRPDQIEAALGYYAEFTDEIDAEMAANAAAAEEAEALWQRRQGLLAG